MDTKICGKCKMAKMLSEFGKSKRDGYQSWCKACRREWLAQYEETEHYKEYRKVYNEVYRRRPGVAERRKAYDSRPENVEKKRLYRQANKESTKGYNEEYSQRPEVMARRKVYRQRPDVKVKYFARSYLGHAIRAGRITRQTCVVCGNEKAHGHHEDYSKPLAVIWLCSKCHTDLHSEVAIV